MAVDFSCRSCRLVLLNTAVSDPLFILLLFGRVCSCWRGRGYASGGARGAVAGPLAYYLLIRVSCLRQWLCVVLCTDQLKHQFAKAEMGTLSLERKQIPIQNSTEAREVANFPND